MSKKNKTEIFYFTGTGNSYMLAKELSKNLNDSAIIPIAKRFNENNFTTNAQKIGFVFPLYYYGLPLIVENFIKKLNIDNADFIFYVVDCGGQPKEPCFTTYSINKLLKSKNKQLNAGYRVVMPSNYIIMYDLEKDKTIEKKIRQSKIRIKTIAGSINKNTEHSSDDISVIYSKITHKIWKFFLNKSDKRYYVTDKCNSCGICVKVCPVNNIQLENKKPVWLHHCEECLACIHFCPTQAIQSGKVSLRNKRYHHPEIDIKNIISQKLGKLN